jgi:ATP phosphoribosyltransferase
MTSEYEIKDGQPFRLILPDQKRLRQAFDEVMDRAGLVFEKPSSRAGQGITRDTTGQLPDIETYELRADAGLDWLNDGAADLVIAGQDMLQEYQARNSGQDTGVTSILTMDRISACSMWIAARPEMYIRDFSDLGEMRIATSYPALLQQLLKNQNVTSVRILAQKGGVESTIVAGRADAIFEIVQTGESLKQNGLEKKLLAFNSCAALVRNTEQGSAPRENLINALTSRIETALIPSKEEARPLRAPVERGASDQIVVTRDRARPSVSLM